MITSNLENFEDIRSYESQDLKYVFEALLSDSMFCSLMQKLYPEESLSDIKLKLQSCGDILSFQKTFLSPLILKIMSNLTDGVELECSQITDKNIPYTYVSNHRDIIIDPTFLGLLLLQNDFPDTQEVAIGDNLLIYPWIEHLVRLNKAFIVKRSLNLKDSLIASKKLSSYMHHVINNKKNSIWIAQREGRAKDSNDCTQEAVLKMMTLDGNKDYYKSLCEMNIVPLTLSYEFDPCDYLKAEEFQLKRDNPEYKKTKLNDLSNMQVGIMGYKGRVCYRMSQCINNWLADYRDQEKRNFFGSVAKRIDREIHKNYVLYPINYIAADLIRKDQRYRSMYLLEDVEKVNTYLFNQIKKIELADKDEPYLKECMLRMYANPLFNYEKAILD